MMIILMTYVYVALVVETDTTQKFKDNGGLDAVNLQSVLLIINL